LAMLTTLVSAALLGPSSPSPMEEPEPVGPVSTAAPIDEPPDAEAGPSGPRRRLTPREKRGRARIGVRWKVAGELGALGVLYHHLQFGKDGTSFDLRRDGRQDTMFLFGRLSTELE